MNVPTDSPDSENTEEGSESENIVEDNTIAPDKIPQTGTKVIIPFVILINCVIMCISYKLYRINRDVR